MSKLCVNQDRVIFSNVATSMMQECLAENNRDWRACQKGGTSLTCIASFLAIPRGCHCTESMTLCHAMQRCKPGSSAIRELSRSKSQAYQTAENDVPAPQTSMSELNLPLLYRHILRAAQRFPSIKRDSIVQEIKAEFAANKVRVHDHIG